MTDLPLAPYLRFAARVITVHLLGGLDLFVFLARLPRYPILAFQPVDLGELLGLCCVEVYERRFEPILLERLQIAADSGLGQPDLLGDVGLNPALQIEVSYPPPIPC